VICMLQVIDSALYRNASGVHETAALLQVASEIQLIGQTVRFAGDHRAFDVDLMAIHAY
jgi:hypothetical protein